MSSVSPTPAVRTPPPVCSLKLGVVLVPPRHTSDLPPRQVCPPPPSPFPQPLPQFRWYHLSPGFYYHKLPPEFPSPRSHSTFYSVTRVTFPEHSLVMSVCSKPPWGFHQEIASALGSSCSPVAQGKHTAPFALPNCSPSLASLLLPTVPFLLIPTCPSDVVQMQPFGAPG